MAPIAAQQASTPQPAEPDRRTTNSVRVERELIHVPPPRRDAPVSRADLHRPNAVKFAAVRGPAARPPNSVIGRARRMLLGDGRYRPEPFPRPGR
jgi:hypothetical protein